MGVDERVGEDGFAGETLAPQESREEEEEGEDNAERV